MLTPIHTHKIIRPFVISTAMFDISCDKTVDDGPKPKDKKYPSKNFLCKVIGHHQGSTLYSTESEQLSDLRQGKRKFNVTTRPRTQKNTSSTPSQGLRWIGSIDYHLHLNSI